MTSSISNKHLARLGRLIVEQVRDTTIQQWDRKVDDDLRGESPEARALVSGLGPDGKKLLREIIPEVVDTTLHYMMFLLEQGDFHGLTLALTTEDGDTCPNVSEVSDGLSGDLLSWTPAFSKQRYKALPGVAERARASLKAVDDGDGKEDV